MFEDFVCDLRRDAAVAVAEMLRDGRLDIRDLSARAGLQEAKVKNSINAWLMNRQTARKDPVDLRTLLRLTHAAGLRLRVTVEAQQ